MLRVQAIGGTSPPANKAGQARRLNGCYTTSLASETIFM